MSEFDFGKQSNPLAIYSRFKHSMQKRGVDENCQVCG